MQRLVGQKSPVQRVHFSSRYQKGQFVARKIQSDGRTTCLQHLKSLNLVHTRSVFPIAWKPPAPSAEDAKSAEEKYTNLAKTAQWKSRTASQIQVMYRIYREQLKRKMETIPLEELQAWSDKYLMDGESPPKLRSPIKSLFATKQDWEKELTKLADKMLGGEVEFQERFKKFEIEMFSDEHHPIWSDEYAQLYQISPQYYMENAEFQVLMASMRALESKRENGLFKDLYAEELVKGSGPLLSKYYAALKHFAEIHVLEPAKLFTSEDALATDVLANYEKLFPTDTDRDLARDYFAVRTKYFDDFLQDKLINPDALYLDHHTKHYTNDRQVVILGAGLDMRAFRLQFPPRTTVFEIDDEEIMEYKEKLIEKNRWKPNCARRVAIATSPISDVWEVMLSRVGFRDYIPTIWIAEGSCSRVHSQLVYRGSLMSSVGSWCVMDMFGAGNSFNPSFLLHPGQVPFKTKRPQKELSHRGYSLCHADEIGGPRVNYGRLPQQSLLSKLFFGPPGYFVCGQKLPVDEAANKMKKLAGKQMLSEMKKGKLGPFAGRPEARMQQAELEYDMFNMEQGSGINKRRDMQKALRNIYIGTDVGKLLSTKDDQLIGQIQDRIVELETELIRRKDQIENHNKRTPEEEAKEQNEFYQKIYNGFQQIILDSWIEFEEYRKDHQQSERYFLLRELESIVAGKVAELFLYPDKYDEKPIDTLIREEAFAKDEERYFKDVVVRKAWMYLSEGLTKLGVDTKENNESKAYRWIQNLIDPKKPPELQKTQEQLNFEKIFEEDKKKCEEWDEELEERQIMLHETAAEYAHGRMEQYVQLADPRPIKHKRWINASDRLLKEDIPLDLQEKEKEVMFRLLKHGLTEEEKEIYQMRRDWKLRRQFVYQHSRSSYEVGEALYQIDQEEQAAKKKGKWRDDAWFMKIDQMVQSWQKLGDPSSMPQVEKNQPVPQPYLLKNPRKIRDLNLAIEEERQQGKDIIKYFHPKAAKEGQFFMLQNDPTINAVPRLDQDAPPGGELPQYLRWLYGRYRSAMPEPPFRGLIKRLEMTRLLRDRARSWRRVKNLPKLRLERRPPVRKNAWKTDPMTQEEKKEHYKERARWIQSRPRWRKKVPTTSAVWKKYNNLAHWEVFDEWKKEYHGEKIPKGEEGTETPEKEEEQGGKDNK